MNQLAKVTQKLSPNVFKRTFVANQIVFNQAPGQQSAEPAVNSEVPGLSSACIHSESSKIIPGASKDGDYKNPEYFCYDKTSYFEAEIEMLKYRCPQPSALKD